MTQSRWRQTLAAVAVGAVLAMGSRAFGADQASPPPPPPPPPAAADAPAQPPAQPLGAAAAPNPAVSPEEIQRLVAAISAADEPQRAEARKRLVAAGQAAVVPLMEVLASPQQPAAHRTAAAETLIAVGKPAEAALSDALSHPDAFVRAAAAGAVGRIHAVDTVPVLLKCLVDGDANVRASAARSLGLLGDANSADGLARASRDDTTLEVRVASAEALGRLACRAAIEPLADALSDPHPQVRRTAAVALGSMGGLLASGRRGEIGRGRAAKGLIAALTDPEGAVRAEAAKALGLMADRRALEPLTQRLTDPDARMPAVEAIGRIGTPAAREVLKDVAANGADPAIRDAAAQALRTMKKR